MTLPLDMDSAAKQAAKARGETLRPKKPQLPPAGLFAPREPVQRGLFGDK